MCDSHNCFPLSASDFIQWLARLQQFNRGIVSAVTLAFTNTDYVIMSAQRWLSERPTGSDIHCNHGVSNLLQLPCLYLYFYACLRVAVVNYPLVTGYSTCPFQTSHALVLPLCVSFYSFSSTNWGKLWQ